MTLEHSLQLLYRGRVCLVQQMIFGDLLQPEKETGASFGFMGWRIRVALAR